MGCSCVMCLTDFRAGGGWVAGVILLLGKHQFIVERIETCEGEVASSASRSQVSSEADDKVDSYATTVSRGVSTPRASPVSAAEGEGEGGIEDIVGEAEDLLEALEMMEVSACSEEERCGLDTHTHTHIHTQRYNTLQHDTCCETFRSEEGVMRG